MNLLPPGRAVERTDSRWPCGLDPSSSRSPTPTGILFSLRDPGDVENGVRHSLRKAYCGMPEEINVTAQALMRGTRSSGMGKIIAVATGQDKNPWPFGPDWRGSVGSSQRAWMKQPSTIKQAFRDAQWRALGLDCAHVRRSDFIRARAPGERTQPTGSADEVHRRTGAATSVP